MDTIFTCLRTLSDQTFGTIVHVGAGHAGMLEHYAEIDATRIVLIEGDLEIGAELQRNAASHPRVEILMRAVAAEASTATWHRYNLQTLNGPLDAEGLKTYYPRLRLLESLPQTTVALSVVLAELSLSTPGGRTNVLVLDVPGQEDALLASLPSDQITRFGVVLVRGCRESSSPGGTCAQRAVDQLLGRSFLLAGSDHDSEPLWPVTLLQLDTAGVLRLQALAQERLIDRLRAASAVAAAQVEAANHLAAERLSRIDSLRDAAQIAAKAVAACRTELDEANRQHEADQEAKAALELARATTDKDNAERIDNLSTQVAQLTRERDEQTRLANERYLTIAALTKDKSELEAPLTAQTAKVDAVIAERDLQTKLADSRYLSIKDLTQKNVELELQVQMLSKERDEHKHWHFENEKWGQDLKAKNEKLTVSLATLRSSGETLTSKVAEAEAATKALGNQLAERDARQRLMDAEILKAEAQLDLIKDVLIREKNF